MNNAKRNWIASVTRTALVLLAHGTSAFAVDAGPNVLVIDGVRTVDGPGKRNVDDVFVLEATPCAFQREFKDYRESETAKDLSALTLHIGRPGKLKSVGVTAYEHIQWSDFYNDTYEYHSITTDRGETIRRCDVNYGSGDRMIWAPSRSYFQQYRAEIESLCGARPEWAPRESVPSVASRELRISGETHPLVQYDIGSLCPGADSRESTRILLQGK